MYVTKYLSNYFLKLCIGYCKDNNEEHKDALYFFKEEKWISICIENKWKSDSNALKSIFFTDIRRTLDYIITNNVVKVEDKECKNLIEFQNIDRIY